MAGLIYAEPHRLESTASRELLNQFKAIEKIADNDKNVIKTLIDAFITKRKVQQLAL